MDDTYAGIMRSGNDYLEHYGIPGMKWGKRNGPPYPLGASDRSAREKKRLTSPGYEPKGLSPDENGVVTEERVKEQQRAEREGKKKGFSLTDDQKKALIIGAAVTAGLLATYGYLKYKKVHGGDYDIIPDDANLERLYPGLYTTKLKKISEEGLSGKINTTEAWEDADTAKLSLLGVNKGRAYMEASNPLKLGILSSITGDYSNNCAHCSMAVELRRRGYDVVATRADGEGVDWFRKFYKDLSPEDMHITNPVNQSSLIPTITKSVADKSKTDFIDGIKKMPPGSRGQMTVLWGMQGGHAINWDVASDGTMRILDGQIGEVYSGESAVRDYLARATGGVTSWFRSDNLTLSPNMLNEAVHNNTNVNLFADTNGEDVTQAILKSAAGGVIAGTLASKHETKKKTYDNS